VQFITGWPEAIMQLAKPVPIVLRGGGGEKRVLSARPGEIFK